MAKVTTKSKKDTMINEQLKAKSQNNEATAIKSTTNQPTARKADNINLNSFLVQQKNICTMLLKKLLLIRSKSKNNSNDGKSFNKQDKKKCHNSSILVDKSRLLLYLIGHNVKNLKLITKT